MQRKGNGVAWVRIPKHKKASGRFSVCSGLPASKLCHTRLSAIFKHPAPLPSRLSKLSSPSSPKKRVQRLDQTSIPKICILETAQLACLDLDGYPNTPLRYTTTPCFPPNTPILPRACPENGAWSSLATPPEPPNPVNQSSEERKQACNTHCQTTLHRSPRVLVYKF